MSDEYRTWVYHATEKPKIVNREMAETLYDQGWADTPAVFIKTTDFGIDPDDEVNVQALGATVEAVKDRLNDELNFDSMTNKEIDAYAEKHHDTNFDLRSYRGKKGRERLLAEAKEMAAG